MNVLHLDPYRLPEGKIASLIDLAPAFEKHVCLIEWPERLGNQLVTPEHPPRLEISLGGIGPQACGRAVTMRAVGERWDAVLSAWSAAGRVDVTLPPPREEAMIEDEEGTEGGADEPQQPSHSGPPVTQRSRAARPL